MHPSSLGLGPRNGWCSLRAPRTQAQVPALKEGSTHSPTPILWLLLLSSLCGLGVTCKE